MSAQLGYYRENRDRFIVGITDESTDDMTVYVLSVLYVINNDPNHSVQYKAGDSFSVSVSKTIPGAAAYCGWTMDKFDAPVIA